jgi:hypothetical protein
MPAADRTTAVRSPGSSRDETSTFSMPEQAGLQRYDAAASRGGAHPVPSSPRKGQSKKRLLAFVAIGTLTAAAFAVPTSGTAGAASQEVYVVHGIPGYPVNVCVGDSTTPAITDFEPGDTSDALPLPAGDYDISLVATGDGCNPANLIRLLERRQRQGERCRDVHRARQGSQAQADR